MQRNVLEWCYIFNYSHYTTCESNGPRLRSDLFRSVNNAGKCEIKQTSGMKADGVRDALHVASAMAAKFGLTVGVSILTAQEI